MRSNRAALIILSCLIASFMFSSAVTLHTPVQALADATAAATQPAFPCDLGFYVDVFQNGLPKVDADVSSVLAQDLADSSKTAKLAYQVLGNISTLRHKYEDMTVSQICLPTKTLVIAVIDNQVDEVNLVLASDNDPQNIQSYLGKMHLQDQRLKDEKQKLGEMVPNLS